MTSITALSGINSLTGVGGTTAATQLGSTTGASGSSFSSVLGGVVDNLSGLQNTVNTLAVKAVTGDLTDIHQPRSRRPARRSRWISSPRCGTRASTRSTRS